MAVATEGLVLDSDPGCEDIDGRSEARLLDAKARCMVDGKEGYATRQIEVVQVQLFQVQQDVTAVGVKGKI